MIYAPERQNVPLYMYAHPKELQRLMAAITLANQKAEQDQQIKTAVKEMSLVFNVVQTSPVVNLIDHVLALQAKKQDQFMKLT